jgi:hypothetical protein
MAACAGSVAGEVDVTWSTAPSPAVSGSATLADFVLRDAGGPVRGATLSIEGHMTHPGMSPVLAVAEEQPDGVYRARLEFPMAGEWVVLVRGSLPDGRRVNRRIDIGHVRPAG